MSSTECFLTSLNNRRGEGWNILSPSFCWDTQTQSALRTSRWDKFCFICRRYGAVEGGRFCYEGGTRCGRGEGLHVFRVDNPEDLQISFDLASKAKLENKKRAASSGFASELGKSIRKSVKFVKLEMGENICVIISWQLFVLAIFCVWPRCTMCEESLWPFLLNTKIHIFQIITRLINLTAANNKSNIG